MCPLYSPSERGACPGLTSCLFWSHTSGKRASSECESVRAKAVQHDRRGNEISTKVSQPKNDRSDGLAGVGWSVLTQRKGYKKTKLWLVSISSRCNETDSKRRGLVGCGGRRILDVSCEEVGAGGADLWCEEALLVLQVVAHAVLEGLAEGVVPAGQESRAGRREGKVSVLWDISHKKSCPIAPDTSSNCMKHKI